MEKANWDYQPKEKILSSIRDSTIKQVLAVCMSEKKPEEKISIIMGAVALCANIEGEMFSNEDS